MTQPLIFLFSLPSLPFFNALGSHSVLIPPHRLLGLLEVHRDARDPRRSPGTIHESDVFAGLRLALNDTQDTSLLGGALVDPDTGAVFAVLEAERRLGESSKLEIEARVFSGAADDPAAAAFAEDDHLTVRWSWFF